MKARRVEKVARGEAVTIIVDGVAVRAFAGETIATALLAGESPWMRLDRSGRARSLFCNMGTCCECMVTIDDGDRPAYRVRSCLVAVAEGLRVSRGAHRDG